MIEANKAMAEGLLQANDRFNIEMFQLPMVEKVRLKRWFMQQKVILWIEWSGLYLRTAKGGTPEMIKELDKGLLKLPQNS